MINSDKFYQDYSAATATALKNPLKNDRFARRSLCQTISIVNTTLVFIAEMCDRRVARRWKSDRRGGCEIRVPSATLLSYDFRAQGIAEHSD